MAGRYTSTLVNRDIPSMLNGVSQQPASYRLDSQCEEQVNMYPSLVEGLTVRPNSEFYRTLRLTGSNSPAADDFYNAEFLDDDVFVHIVDRGEGDYPNVYMLGTVNDALLTTPTEDFKLNIITADYGVGNFGVSTEVLPYLLTVGSPLADVKMTTVEDFTFVVNRKAVCAMNEDEETLSDYPLTGTTQSFSTAPTSSVPSEAVYKVEGDPSNVFDNFYIQWQGSAYTEVSADNITTEYDVDTMPIWGEPSTGSGFNELVWGNRLTGDDDTNPLPSFIGRSINQMFLHKNRLGFIAGENIILSSSPAGDFQFFKDTATALLDTDPIDVAATHTKSSVLYHAVSFDRSLLLFSDKNQFLLTGGDVLTPGTATLDVTTEFACSKICEPVTSGNNVYFTADRGDYSIFREYFVNADVATNDAADITAHVPVYIPKGVFKMTVSNLEDTLFALTTEERNAIYVYKYYWKGDEKVQSAWSKWDLGEDVTILGMEVIDNYLWLVTRRDFLENDGQAGGNSVRGTVLERINLQPNHVDEGLSFNASLDCKTVLTGTHDEGLTPEENNAFDLGIGRYDGQTYYPIPDYFLRTGKDITVVLGKGATNPGEFHLIPGNYIDDFGGYFEVSMKMTYVASLDQWCFVTPGDTSGMELIVGFPINWNYKFSEFFMKNDDGAPITDGRLMLKRMDVNFTNTVTFNAKVALEHRGEYTYEFNDTLGVTTITDTLSKKDGSFTIPLLGDSREVTVELSGNSIYPASFQSASWTGLFHPRSSRS